MIQIHGFFYSNRCFVLLLCILTTSTLFQSNALAEPLAKSSSQDAYNYKHLQALFNSYKRKQSYDYASQYLSEQEGNPEFDYIYGVSAIDAGYASNGVFALERVLLAYPEDHVARLELARGYFILEEYSRARQEFEAVLEVKPPETVKDTTLAYLDQIRLREARYRTTSSGFIELATGTDSNVNSGPDNDDLLIINLDERSLGQDDTFSELAAAWQITSPVAPGWVINSSLTGAFRFNHDLDEFNTATGTLQLGMARLYKQSRYKAGLLYQQFNLDGNDYRTLAGLNLEWNYSLSQKSRFITILQYATLEYQDIPLNDSDLSTLSLGFNHTFSGPLSPMLFTSLNFSNESADSNDPGALDNTERDILGIQLGTALTFTSKLALQISASYQNSEYAGAQVFAAFNNAIREDDYTTADINLLWVFRRDWRLDTKFTYLDNSSNIEIYNYDRNIFRLNLNYSF